MEITIGVIFLVLWYIAGTTTLACKEVPKVSYAIAWINLLIQIIDNYLIT